MKKLSILNIFYIIVSLLFLALGLFGISRLHLRSELPFRWEKAGDQIIVVDSLNNKAVSKQILVKGDRLLNIASFPIQTGREIDFVLDNHVTGDKILCIVQRGEKVFPVAFTLLARFHKRFIVINLLLGLMFWIVGIFVYLSKPLEKAARVFFWGCMTLSTAILCNWQGYAFHAGLFGWIQQTLYLIIYPLAPAFILYFTLIYPKERRVVLKHRFLSIILFVPSLLFIILLQTSYLSAIYLKSIKQYLKFINFYNGFRVYLILYLILSIGFFINSYRNSDTHENRNKIRWILWGMCVGAFPFLFLWTLPILLGFSPLIPEEINYIFLMIVPLAFGFSIAKYQALDIEVIINRSIVYVLVTGILIVFYLIIVGLAGHFLYVLSARPGSYFTIIFTLAAVLLFSPLKTRIQKFVDKTFYRVKYNYRLAIKDFSNVVTSAHDPVQLTNLILKKIDAVIPIDKIAIMMWSQPEQIFKLASQHRMNEEELFDLRSELGKDLGRFIDKNRTPVIKSGRSELRDYTELPENSVLNRIGVEIIIPITLQEKIFGLLALGKKLSAKKYSEEDIELIITMANEGFMALERIKLQETMIIEQAEKAKLKEISDLKSEFVSHVSHELRTPLTAIQWSIENLLDGIPELPTPRIRQYLEGIYNSSKHLARMIENLLDISRIEAGRIEIHAERLNLHGEIQAILEAAKPLADRKQIQFDIDIPDGVEAKADRDCLKEILINLLDNAIKYSANGRIIQIKAKNAETVDSKKAGKNIHGMAVISVVDEGIGIPAEKQGAIFERFSRVKTDKSAREKGLGLGLHIVKKLVELQGGVIWVESEEGKGSVFSFTLPYY